ncbi:MAG: 16S rRNA (cytosine(1402)-N(4))-methyltransferase RsmH [Candidatus Omnitrophica bacterium]|nr:16S rRNA (cytosine(1402)-N(4))-methyltransferase RsmH [Candidatus Omnitrophota bacterium]
MSEAAALQWHQPVMGAEVLEALNPRPGATVVDGTVGTGGHSLMILPRLLPDGRLVGIERDQDALELARKRLADFEPQATLLHGNYRRLPAILQELGIPRADGLLLDLGISSLQVDRAERGFSFSREGPLDMRMDREQEETAEAVVNELAADELALLLETLGEERFARRIARAIVRAREDGRLTTTTQLARVVAGAVPPAARHGRLHPATRTFQALRMAVNDELGALETLLGHLDAVLSPGGRAVIITFHSLEDRLVKRAFLSGARERRWTVLTKKPARPSAEEVARNPRARSAKLRAIEKR